MPLLECENLSLKYGNTTVVTDISFSVEAGDYVCIVGENGSGKSTLMKALLGLLPVAEGQIRFASDFKRTEIGYLPQQTALQKDFPTTVNEVVLSGCLNRKGLFPFYTKGDKARADAALKRIAAYELKKMSYASLSGGQQQRVLLARALCATTSLLLLDEPVAALDPVATADFYSLIDSLNHDDKITIIMISHDIQTAVAHASKLLHLNNAMEFFGTPDDYVHTDAGKSFVGEVDNG